MLAGGVADLVFTELRVRERAAAEERREDKVANEADLKERQKEDEQRARSRSVNEFVRLGLIKLGRILEIILSQNRFDLVRKRDGAAGSDG